MNRALPATMVDLIRDGVRPADLKIRGDVAVYNALVRTATSARQRGQTQPEWTAFVSETKSKLGAQARLKSGKKERTSRDYHRTLSNAWTAAGKWLLTADAPLDAEQIRARANETTAAVATFAADPDVPLPDAHRALLAYAADFARNNGTCRPALSRRNVAKATGLSERAARGALEDLVRGGVLVLEVRGRSSSDPKRQRANLYRLPDAAALALYLQYRGTRSVGQSHWSMGQSHFDGSGRALVYGPHPAESKDGQMFEFTIRASSEPVAAAALRAAAGVLEQHGLAVAAPGVGADKAPGVGADKAPGVGADKAPGVGADNVVPLRPDHVVRRSAS